MPNVTARNYLTLPTGSYSVGNGLVLRIVDSRGYWIFRYQLNGRRRDFSIGTTEYVTPSEAKAHAMKLRLRVLEGIDPIDEFKNNLKEEETEFNAPTFRELYVPAIEHIASVKRWKNKKHKQQWFNTIATYAVPVIGDLRPNEITIDEVLNILKPIWECKTQTASRVRGRLEHIFDYSIHKGYMSENPALWKRNLEFHLPPFNKVHKVKHFGAMPLHVLRDFVRFAVQKKRRGDMCLLFGTLTAMRVSEYVECRKSEIDFVNHVWTCPGDRMKEEVEHRVPLSLQALRIIYRELDRSRSDDYVFSRTRGRHLSIELPKKQAKLFSPGSTAHGMRSTFRDWAATNGVDFELAEMCLAHKVGDETVNAYRRTDRLEERRAVMQAWADEIMPRDL